MQEFPLCQLWRSLVFWFARWRIQPNNVKNWPVKGRFQGLLEVAGTRYLFFVPTIDKIQKNGVLPQLEIFELGTEKFISLLAL